MDQAIVEQAIMETEADIMVMVGDFTVTEE
jgi:hypothetical protein